MKKTFEEMRNYLEGLGYEFIDPESTCFEGLGCDGVFEKAFEREQPETQDFTVRIAIEGTSAWIEIEPEFEEIEMRNIKTMIALELEVEKDLKDNIGVRVMNW